MPHSDTRLTLTVVIPAYNEERLLLRCLTAIAAQTDPVDEIIVVDNRSTDATAEIASGFPGVTLVTEHRQGITYARTTGFDRATSDIIARIDADTLVAHHWAAAIRREFAADPEVGALAGGAAVAEVSPPRLYWMRWFYRGFRYWHERSIGVRPMMYGFNSALRRSVWNAIRPNITLGDREISEDVDVTICVLKGGYRVKFVPDMVVKAHLFRSLKPGKLSEYYRTDGVTLRDHAYGNRSRWITEEPEHGAAEPA